MATPSPAQHAKPAALSSDSTAPSLFDRHLLQRTTDKPEIHFTHYDYAIAGVLLLSFALYVWLYVTNRKRLNQVIRAFYISRYANQLSRDEVSMGNRVSIFLSILFIISLGLFMVQVNSYYQVFPLPEGPAGFAVAATIITVAYFVKILVIKFLGYVFQTVKEAGDYVLSLFLFGNTLGLFMMPVVICLAFAKQLPERVFIYSGLAVIATFLCARLVRGVVIGMNSSRVSGFYLFLYLCTLEILPFIVLIKLFILS